VKKEPSLKDEPHMKDEQMEEMAPEEDERPWWVKERELQNAACHPDGPVDTSGLHPLQARSYCEAQAMPEARAATWSAQDSGNIIDLAKDDYNVKEEY
jgi:hypothetical protein